MGTQPIQFEILLERLQSHLHLEWIYQEDAKQKAEVGVQADREPVQIISLPPEETTTLLELARLGIVKQTLAELDTFEQQDTKYTSILKILRQFAKTYQFDRIIELLEKRSGANGT